MNKQLTEGKRLAWNCIYNTGHTLESSNLTLFKEHHSYRYMTEVYAHIEKLEAENEKLKDALNLIIKQFPVDYDIRITEIAKEALKGT